MSVTITDLRTLRNEADAITDWAGSHSPALYTDAPGPIESTGHLGVSVSVESGYTVHTPGGQVDLSSTLVYGWLQPGPAMATLANNGFGIVLSDGTNIIQYNLGGQDIAAFRHSMGVPSYQCVVLDTASLPASTLAHAGSAGALSLTAITGIGYGFTTTLKALGGTENVFFDIVRYGTLGLRVAGGTSVDPGTFGDVATDDALTTDQKAYGAIRELGTGLYGVQAPLVFGGAGGASWFEDTRSTVVFEDRGFLTSRYGISIEDDGVDTATFKFGTKVGTGTDATGTDGVIIIAPPGVGAAFDATTDLDVTDVFLYGSRFQGFTSGFWVRTGMEVIDCVLDGAGQVQADGATMVRTQVLNSAVAADASALCWDVNLDPDTYLHEMTYSRGTNAHHAIEFGTTSPLTMTLRNIDFTGFNASDGMNDSTFYVARTTGTVTINLIGCTGNVSVKSAGATVDVVQNPVTFTVTVVRLDNGAVVEGANVYATAGAGGPLTEGTEIIKGLTDVNGQISDTRTYASDQPIEGHVRKASGSPYFKTAPVSGTIDSGAGLSLTVQMVLDE